MTTTPDDQDWLRLADDAFTATQNEDMEDNGEKQPRWRYRAPVF